MKLTSLHNNADTIKHTKIYTLYVSKYNFPANNQTNENKCTKMNSIDSTVAEFASEPVKTFSNGLIHASADYK